MRCHLGAGQSTGTASILAFTVTLRESPPWTPPSSTLPPGWGHDLPGTQQQLAAQRPGAHLNTLLDETLRDPLSGTAELSGLAITKVVASTA